MSFEVVNLFLFTYHRFYFVIPGPPGAGNLKRLPRSNQGNL